MCVFSWSFSKPPIPLFPVKTFKTIPSLGKKKNDCGAMHAGHVSFLSLKKKNVCVFSCIAQPRLWILDSIHASSGLSHTFSRPIWSPLRSGWQWNKSTVAYIQDAPTDTVLIYPDYTQTKYSRWMHQQVGQIVAKNELLFVSLLCFWGLYAKLCGSYSLNRL